MTQAEELLDANKLEESEALMAEIEELDNAWEEVKLGMANKAALEDVQEMVVMENIDEKLEEAEIMENINVGITEVSYEKAWAKHLQGYKLDNKEVEVFAKFNPDFENAYTHTTVNTPTLIPETVVAGIWKLAEEKYPLLADVR